jgi:hypothetical protein
VAIPDSDVTVQFGAGRAEMNVQNLSMGDYGVLANSLGPNWQTASRPAVVSFDVVWTGPITRRVSVTNGTLGNQYAGNYVENQVTVTWSGTNLATGFTFTANPGTLNTSPKLAFAELGQEQNGIFFSSSTDTAKGVIADAVLTNAPVASPANSANTGTALLTLPIAARPAVITVTNSQAVQATPGPVHAPTGRAHAPLTDQLFADFGHELVESL